MGLLYLCDTRAFTVPGLLPGPIGVAAGARGASGMGVGLGATVELGAPGPTRGFRAVFSSEIMRMRLDIHGLVHMDSCIQRNDYYKLLHCSQQNLTNWIHICTMIYDSSINCTHHCYDSSCTMPVLLLNSLTTKNVSRVGHFLC